MELIGATFIIRLLLLFFIDQFDSEKQRIVNEVVLLHEFDVFLDHGDQGLHVLLAYVERKQGRVPPR